MKKFFAMLEDLWVTAAFAESGEFRMVPERKEDVLSGCPVPEHAC